MKRTPGFIPRLIARSIVLGGWLAAAACKQEPTSSEQYAAQAGQVSPINSVRNTTVRQAVTAIARARCARETRCSNVGPGKTYASERDCLTRRSAEKYDDLNGEECAPGIVDKELAECLEEIEELDCNNPLQIAGLVAACRSSDLCRVLPR